MLFLAYIGAVLAFAIVYFALYVGDVHRFFFVKDLDVAKRSTYAWRLKDTLQMHGKQLDSLQHFLIDLPKDDRDLDFRKSASRREIHNAGYVVLLFNHFVTDCTRPHVPRCTKQAELLFGRENLDRYTLWMLPVSDSEVTGWPETAAEMRAATIKMYRWGREGDQLKVRLDVNEADPAAWGLLDFIYFSTITQITVGYGDILPNSMTVRIVVIAQAITGTFIQFVMLNLLLTSPARRSRGRRRRSIPPS